MQGLRGRLGLIAALLVTLVVSCASPHRDSTSSAKRSSASTEPSGAIAEFDEFLGRYRGLPAKEREAVLSEFIDQQRARSGFPIVSRDGRAIVVYIAESTAHRVSVVGDFLPESFDTVGWRDLGEPMTAASDGGPVYFARFQFEPDARFDYQIIVDGEPRPDPLNARGILSGVAGASSELMMPGYPVDPVFAEPGPNEQGTIREFDGVGETEPRPGLRVYLPPGYDPSAEYPVLYTADGEAWQTLFGLPRILDAMIAAGEIEPLVAVMIDAPPNRSQWYGPAPGYAEYLEQVVAFVEDQYAASPRPDQRVLVGSSAGARGALFVGFKRPDLFHRIGAFSPALHPRQASQAELLSGALTPDPNLKVWLSAGSYEGYIGEAAKKMEERLAAKGVDVRSVYTHEGHSFGAWKNLTPEMLRHFFGRVGAPAWGATLRPATRTSGE